MTGWTVSDASLVSAGAEAPASMMLTLRANIWAQQLGALMNKGVSSSDPDIKLPGSPAYDKYHAALVRADSKSARIANQRNLPAVTIGYAAQLICSGECFMLCSIIPAEVALSQLLERLLSIL